MTEDKGQEFVDWIKAQAADKNSRFHTSCSVSMMYYPFTNECPVDGHGCMREHCKRGFYKKSNARCLKFEINRVEFEVFGYHNNFFDYDMSEDTYWVVTPQIYTDHPQPGEYLGIGVGTYTSNYASIKAIEVSGLRDTLHIKKDEQIKFLRASHRNIPTIKAAYETIKAMASQITIAMIETHRCIKCGTVATSLDVYKNHDDAALCDGCQSTIIDEWLKGTKEAALDDGNPEQIGG